MGGVGLSSCATLQPPDTVPQSGVSGWSTYTVGPSGLEFEYRDDWSVEEAAALANDPAGGVSLRVYDGAGRAIAWLDTGIITDQVCTPLQEPVSYTEYDAQPMPELASAQGTSQRFVYRSLLPSGAGSAVVTYAVVSAPPPSAEEAACGLFDFFSLTEASGGRFAGVVPPDEGGGPQQHLEKAAAYEDSQEFRDVKRMLMSLRNTG